MPRHFTAADVRAMLAERVRRFDSMRAAARAWGVSPAYLSNVLAGKDPPGQRVAAVLKLRRVVSVTYVDS